MTNLKTIKNMLEGRRVALVGASRNPKDFSRAVMRELLDRDYDVVPVNAHADGTIEGRAIVRTIEEVEPRPDWALLMVPAEVTEHVVRACDRAGIDHVWMHRGAGPGSVSEAAIAFCEAHDITCVAGECPLMFLDHPPFVHRIHAFVKKLRGTYPERRTAS